ncbi:MAG: cardiolipin synthase [Clostridia bacterium]|nr:cardiolipin synthase [Clostridia bacterium]
MKKNIEYKVKDKKVVKKINYIPARYIFAMHVSVFEILAIIAVVVALCYFVPYFYIAVYLTQVACVIKILSSDDNPDYKVPWLFFVLVLPVIGFMLYLIFASRKLKKKYVCRLKDLYNTTYEKDDAELLARLSQENVTAANQAKMLLNISDAHLFEHTKTTYFPSGEQMLPVLLSDLKQAEKFIYMEYFIIEEGEFWNSILDVLKEKAKLGVEIKIVYDDIGCMTTLPGNYSKRLKEVGIQATTFARLKGAADGEFNNRNHRKITVIDGYIGYTGGVNIADEYINKKERFGYWKDTAVRLEGEGVWDLTKLFVIDYGINVKYIPESVHDLYPKVTDKTDNGYVIPFGDGPKPLYQRGVGKSVIQSMLSAANEYVYITTPYLIIDNDLCQDIENTAMRGVDVRIIVPSIPDKKIVYEMTRSFYNRLMSAGVKIYEYTPGFVHAKTYLVDDKYAMVGTINLDYRSLVHHFENGVWLYDNDCIADIRKDLDDTLSKSELVTEEMKKAGIFKRFLRATLRVFAPLL